MILGRTNLVTLHENYQARSLWLQYINRGDMWFFRACNMTICMNLQMNLPWTPSLEVWKLAALRQISIICKVEVTEVCRSSTLQLIVLSSTILGSLVVLPFCYLVAHLFLSMSNNLEKRRAESMELDWQSEDTFSAQNTASFRSPISRPNFWMALKENRLYKAHRCMLSATHCPFLTPWWCLLATCHLQRITWWTYISWQLAGQREPSLSTTMDLSHESVMLFWAQIS